MKKIFLLCSILILVSGCYKKNIKYDKLNDEQIDFTCVIEPNNIFNCDNEILTYDENNNIKSIISKNSISEYYNYTYNNNNLVSSIERKNGEQILISYNKKNNVSRIKYIMDPSIEEKKRTIIIYDFSYDKDNKLKEIIKSYNNISKSDVITYEYYKNSNEEYVKEIKTINQKKITRIFKINNIKIVDNAFTLANFFPNEYYNNLSYYPYYNFLSINYGKITDVPIFIPSINTIETTSFSGKKINVTNYYFDSYNRFITDSENSIIHNFDDTNDDKIIRNTIYMESFDDLSFITYYKYKTEYITKNDQIVKFIKYKKEEILESEYNSLKNEYLKDIIK